MIAKILNEAMLPKKNNSALLKHLDDWRIADFPGSYNLSDGKPGTWFVKEIESSLSKDKIEILVFSASMEIEYGTADYLLVYNNEVGSPDSYPATLFHYARYGEPCSPKDKAQAKVNSACMRKFVRDLANVTTSGELDKKIKAVHRASEKKKVWR